MRARQGVRQDVVGARDELRSQTDGERLRPAQDLLSNAVQQGRPGAPLLAEVCYCSDVVAENCDRTASQRQLKMEETVLDRQQLPGID